MPALSTWNLDPTRLLTRRELATVLADLSAKADRINIWRNLIIVRLACCCGLRVSEIAGLQLDDVVGAAHFCMRAASGSVTVILSVFV